MVFGQELIESAREALAIAEGISQPGAVFTPESIDVATLRKSLGLSQSRFAERYCLPVSTIRDWEQGRRRPDRAAFLLLRLIEAEPELVAKTLANADAPTARRSCAPSD